MSMTHLLPPTMRSVGEFVQGMNQMVMVIYDNFRAILV
jgi:hypothetical protein